MARKRGGFRRERKEQERDITGERESKAQRRILPRAPLLRHPLVVRVEARDLKPSARQTSLDVQFLRDELAAHLDPVLVFAGGGKVVGELHAQPRFLRAAEGLG